MLYFLYHKKWPVRIAGLCRLTRLWLDLPIQGGCGLILDLFSWWPHAAYLVPGTAEVLRDDCHLGAIKQFEAHILAVDLHATRPDNILLRATCWDKCAMSSYYCLGREMSTTSTIDLKRQYIDSKMSCVCTCAAANQWHESQVLWMGASPHLMQDLEGWGHAVGGLDEWNWVLLPYAMALCWSVINRWGHFSGSPPNHILFPGATWWSWLSLRSVQDTCVFFGIKIRGREHQ